MYLGKQTSTFLSIGVDGCGQLGMAGAGHVASVNYICIHFQISTSTQTFLGYTVGTMVVFGYSFMLASYVLFLVQERESKVCSNWTAKHDWVM